MIILSDDHFVLLQPIYLNLMMRHGSPLSCSGNTSPITPTPSTSDEIPTHKPLKKVISINGEEVDSSDMESINIHDFAQFEREQHITNEFFSTIKRRSESSEQDLNSPTRKSVHRQRSFKDVARDVIKLDQVLKAFKHYAHRSDSEVSDDDDVIDNDNKKLLVNNNNYSRPHSGHQAETQVLLNPGQPVGEAAVHIEVTINEPHASHSDEKDWSSASLLHNTDIPDVVPHTVSDGTDNIYKPTTLAVQQSESDNIRNNNKCPSCIIL